MTEAGAPVAALLPSWDLSLAERDLSPKTREVYLCIGGPLVAWLQGQGLPADSSGTDPPRLRAFLAAETERTSAVSAHQHYAASESCSAGWPSSAPARRTPSCHPATGSERHTPTKPLLEGTWVT